MLGYLKRKAQEVLLVHRPSVLLRRSLRVTKDPIKQFIPHFCNPEKISLDIGGAVGGYALMMMPYSKRTYVFEPNPRQAAAIRTRFAAMPERVIVVEQALSDESGTISLRVPDNNSGRATIESENRLLPGDAVSVHQVARGRLDDLDLADVGFMKVDVEGHEAAVFRGGHRLLERCRPVIFIEIEERHKPGAVAAMFAQFREWRYQGFFLERGALRSIADFEVAVHQKPGLAKGAYINNFLFFPDAATTDRMADLAARSQRSGHPLPLPDGR